MPFPAQPEVIRESCYIQPKLQTQRLIALTHMHYQVVFSADSIRASGHQVPHQQAGYKTAICLTVTPKSVLASREASIQKP